MSALEKSLNNTLPHYTTHIVELTEAGQIYHTRALSMIASLGDILRVVSDFALRLCGFL